MASKGETKALRLPYLVNLGESSGFEIRRKQDIDRCVRTMYDAIDTLESIAAFDRNRAGTLATEVLVKHGIWTHAVMRVEPCDICLNAAGRPPTLSPMLRKLLLDHCRKEGH